MSGDLSRIRRNEDKVCTKCGETGRYKTLAWCLPCFRLYQTTRRRELKELGVKRLTKDKEVVEEVSDEPDSIKNLKRFVDTIESRGGLASRGEIFGDLIELHSQFLSGKGLDSMSTNDQLSKMWMELKRLRASLEDKNNNIILCKTCGFLPATIKKDKAGREYGYECGTCSRRRNKPRCGICKMKKSEVNPDCDHKDTTKRCDLCHNEVVRAGLCEFHNEEKKSKTKERPCSYCGKGKRRPNASWCANCTNEYQRLKTKGEKLERKTPTGMCPRCLQVPRHPGRSWCLECSKKYYLENKERVKARIIEKISTKKGSST